MVMFRHYPPPLYKLRQCTELLRSLRPLELGQGRSLRETHTATDTNVRVRMVWVHLDLHPPFQVYANTRQPWEHENFRFTPMLAQAMKNAKPTNVRLGNPSCDYTPC